MYAFGVLLWEILPLRESRWAAMPADLLRTRCCSAPRSDWIARFVCGSSSGSPWSECTHPYAAWRRVKEEGARPLITADDEGGAPPGYVALLRECWAQEPSARPTMRAVVDRLSSQLQATEKSPTLFSVAPPASGP